MFKNGHAVWTLLLPSANVNKNSVHDGKDLCLYNQRPMYSQADLQYLIHPFLMRLSATIIFSALDKWLNLLFFDE